jgi:hypothetical protein
MALPLLLCTVYIPPGAVHVVGNLALSLSLYAVRKEGRGGVCAATTRLDFCIGNCIFLVVYCGSKCLCFGTVRYTGGISVDEWRLGNLCLRVSSHLTRSVRHVSHTSPNNVVPGGTSIILSLISLFVLGWQSQERLEPLLAASPCSAVGAGDDAQTRIWGCWGCFGVVHPVRIALACWAGLGGLESRLLEAFCSLSDGAVAVSWLMGTCSCVWKLAWW